MLTLYTINIHRYNIILRFRWGRHRTFNSAFLLIFGLSFVGGLRQTSGFLTNSNEMLFYRMDICMQVEKTKLYTHISRQRPKQMAQSNIIWQVFTKYTTYISKNSNVCVVITIESKVRQSIPSLLFWVNGYKVSFNQVKECL